ncbi:transporter [Ganoderma sinense ZZ0214-1]|uniref:Transporter n=1 Tax=Ganoderma sinense ZZ0214-1 TaxID=1077348 RepID=A0A2G8SDS3_9APHY|nr:transporter [Ganoderma sinense ZZ0214-1]
MADSSALDQNLYGYTPSRAAGYIFVIMFIMTTLFHLFQAIRSRAWWLFPTLVIAGAAEVVGWVARAKSSYDPNIRMAYIIQTTVLVLAPTPLVAALFMGFGKVVRRLGSEYSRLSPTWYSRFFLTIDIFSLFIQGGGGGMAAQGSNDPDKARLGSNIILAGLFVQIISMSFFAFLMAEYTWRRSRNQPFHKGDYNINQTPQAFDSQMKKLLVGIVIPTVLVYIRSIYRIAEFADGFNGSIAHNQTLFIVFDAVFIFLALVTLNFNHPGILLQATAQTQTYALTNTDQRPLQY